MSEYIITVDESKADPDGGIPIKDKREVVRCRDCKWRAGANVQAVVSDLCMWLDIIVKPDDFCVWGEKKVDA